MMRRMVEASTATSPIAATIFGPFVPKRDTRDAWKVVSAARIESPETWARIAATSSLCI